MTPLEWAPFRAELVGRYRSRRRAKKTITKLCQVIDEMGEFAHSTADLTVQNVEKWLASKPERPPMTFNGLISYLRTVCNQAVARGYLDRTPFQNENYRFRVPKSRKRKHLSRAEMASLLAYLESRRHESWKDARLYALAMLLAHTGLRAMEALTLKVEDIDLVEGILEVVARDALKTEESEAIIPLPSAVIPCLADWLGQCGSEWVFPGARLRGPWINGSNGKRPADYLDEAGIAAGLPPGTTLLKFRHSYATHSRTGFGLGAKEVQQILRHTTEFTQNHYISADMDHLRQQVQRIDFRIVG